MPSRDGCSKSWTVPDRPFSRALADAVDGVVSALRGQRNFRTQFVIGALAVLAAAVLRFDEIRWSILVVAIGMVLGAELFNTSLERAVDNASADESEAARAAKHAGAGAVLVASITAAVIGCVLFGTALWSRVHGAR